MDRPLFNDKNEYPNDQVLARHLGKTKGLWDEFTGAAASASLALEWNYYNDGKAWLGKLTHKKKTVCWVSIWKGFLRTSL